MNGTRILTFLLMTGAVPACLADQATSKPTNPTQSGDAFVVPRTPDGQPDLQGVWTNSTRVPLERPEALGAREFYTEEEAAENARNGARGDRPAQYAETQYDFSQYGLDTGQEALAPSLRTSLIVGPTGRIPALTPAAQKRVAEEDAYRKEHLFDGPENRSFAERCIMWPNAGPPMVPGAYNSNMQIVQGPGYVAIYHETIHDPRIIPLDGRPHLPAGLRQRKGSSRGRWEGNTLIIDTTNFSDNIEILKNGFRGTTEGFHVVERLTRIADNLIRYEFTMDDPETWTESWSAEVLMTAIDSPIFEYACHEGNYGMPNILSGARAQEREEAAAKASAK